MFSEGIETDQNKNEKGKQRKKRKSFKAETIKRLSPRSTCYCFSHSRLSKFQKFFLSADSAHLIFVSKPVIAILSGFSIAN